MKQITLFLLLITSLSVYGHVSFTESYTGKTYSIGQTIQIKWKALVVHDPENWDLLFSSDGGTNWEPIDMDLDTSQLSVDWFVPDIVTSKARLRIVQDNITTDYFDETGDFIIQSGTSPGNQLLIPPLLSGETIQLNFQPGTVEFYPGFLTQTVGYNQDYLGPTLILEKGSEVTMNVINNLVETTTLHWHGLHVAPENDGGPHTTIEPGQVWSPSFTIWDNAATYWYHPHLHEHTEEQVTRGGAGCIIVKDEIEAQLELPRSYGVDDFPVVIQSRAFDTDKQFITKTASDSIILANGTLDALLEVPAQVIRLRLLNGSTERVFNLGFENSVVFYQIATDGGLLNAPVSLTRLLLVPGERAEVLLDLSTFQDQTLSLMSFGSEVEVGTYGASRLSFMPFSSIEGYEENALNGNDFEILKLQIKAPTLDPITMIPSTLVVNNPFQEASVDQTRTFTFRPVQMGPTGMVSGPFAINGRTFDFDYINEEIPLGNIEIWELWNMTAIAHPFHIHDVQFYILDINGVAPPLNMQGRKDVVLVPPMGGVVRFITRFTDFANEEVPYMYHCHMLSHEDAGMMGQFIVKGQTTATNNSTEKSISIFPNPTSNMVSIGGLSGSDIELYNTTGQLMERRKKILGEAQFNLEGFTSGIYYFKIISAASSQTYKVIKTNDN